MDLARSPHERYTLDPFEPRLANSVAGWVVTTEQLRWLAPSTGPPLTASKVAAWKRPGGEAFLYNRSDDHTPIAYGELNPMPACREHLWLGHVIVRSDLRGRGIGQRFVKALLSFALEQRRANRVSLIVFPDNAPAIRCYRRVGFVIAGDEYHRFGGRALARRMLRLEIAGLISGRAPFDQSHGVAEAVSGPYPTTRTRASSSGCAPARCASHM